MKLRLIILPAINTLLWGLIFYAGIEGALGVKERTGQIIPMQIFWYAVVPLIALSAPILPAIFLRDEKWADVPTLISWLTLLWLLPWAFLSGGGM